MLRCILLSEFCKYVLATCSQILKQDQYANLALSDPHTYQSRLLAIWSACKQWLPRGELWCLLRCDELHSAFSNVPLLCSSLLEDQAVSTHMDYSTAG